MGKTLEQLWAERPGKKKVAVYQPGHGPVAAQANLLKRMHRLYKAAKVASEKAATDVERQRAQWTMNFLAHAKQDVEKKGHDPRLAVLLSVKEKEYLSE